MERATTIYDAMVREIRDGAAKAAQDLSKGVVPIVLVAALLLPSYYIGRKVEAVQQEQKNAAAKQADTAKTVEEIQGDLKTTLTPLVYQVAALQAKLDAQEDLNRQGERDRKLLESRIKTLEIAIGAQELSGRR